MIDDNEADHLEFMGQILFGLLILGYIISGYFLIKWYISDNTVLVMLLTIIFVMLLSLISKRWIKIVLLKSQIPGGRALVDPFISKNEYKDTNTLVVILILFQLTFIVGSFTIPSVFVYILLADPILMTLSALFAGIWATNEHLSSFPGIFGIIMGIVGIVNSFLQIFGYNLSILLILIGIPLGISNSLFGNQVKEELFK